MELPGGRVAGRVVEERLSERVADGDDVMAPEGALRVRVQLRGQRLEPLAVGIAAEQRVAVGIQSEQVDRVAPPAGIARQGPDGEVPL